MAQIRCEDDVKPIKHLYAFFCQQQQLRSHT